MNTEAEAKKLWCPMSANIDGDQRCLASKCAAWRWNPVPKIGFRRCVNRPDAMTEQQAGDRPKHITASWRFVPDEDGDGAGWIEPEDEQYARRTGYCGLAGNPVGAA